MKIIFLSRLFYPHIGGVEKHVFELSQQLLKKKYEVTVITEQYDESLPLRETYKGIEIFRIPVGKDDFWKKFRIWQWMWQHRCLFQSTDIVHCHDVFFWYLPFSFLNPHTPVFTTFHGYESFPVRWQAIWHRKIAEKLSWSTICIGEFMKKWYKANPTMVLYGGVHIPKIDHYTNKYSAVFIGRLDSQTGIKVYDEAVELLKKTYPKFIFTIVGDGKLKKELHGKIVGFDENTEKYIETHHFAFVSRYLAILEAMVAKRPVIAVYDNPLKKEYLELSPFAQFISIVKTPEEVAQRVQYFLENPDAEKEIVQKGYEWVKTQAWKNLTVTYLHLWHI